MVATPGVIFLLLIFIFNNSSLFISNKLQRVENSWRKYLIQKGFSLSNLNSLEIFPHENKRFSKSQIKFIQEINNVFLQLRYGKKKGNKDLIDEVSQKVAKYKRKN